MTDVERALVGLETARRAGWAKAYSLEAGAALVVVSIAVCLHLRDEYAALESLRKTLEWHAAGQDGRPADGRSQHELDAARDVARRALAEIAEVIHKDWERPR
jgi:hypothetical protein